MTTRRVRPPHHTSLAKQQPKRDALVDEIRGLPAKPRALLIGVLTRLPSPTAKLLGIDLIDREVASRAMSFLAPLLQDSCGEVRLRAVEAAGNLRLRQLVRLVLQLLSDKDWLVRATAAETLGSLATREACEPLSQLLRDNHPLVRGNAAEALAELRCPELAVRLRKLMLHEPSRAARLRFHVALARLGLRNHFFEVVKALESNDYLLRCTAVHALVDITRARDVPQVERALSRRLTDEPTKAVASAIRDGLRRLKAQLPKSETGKGVTH